LAIIKPFCAIRPKEGLEQKIAALPYDVYNRAEAKKEVEKEPMSFLNIDRPETWFDDDTDIYADTVYKKAAQILWERIHSGQFVQETTPCYYIYELTMNQRSQTGIAACASVDDYLNNIIKKHENTREDKEIDRVRHVDTCEAQTGPIFLAYKANQAINKQVELTKKEKCLYDFTTSDQVTHRVWVINSQESIEIITSAFKKINSIYIADGHHRCASAVKVSLMRREQNPDFKGDEEFNFFLSVLFPDEELMIMDYNRVVKDLNGLSEEEFLKEVNKKFLVEKQTDNLNSELRKPEKKGVISMYLNNSWYSLIVKEELLSQDPVEGLDVSILQNNLLAPILGILDPKSDKRIDFVGGIRGLAELERRVKTDCKVAFSMYPTLIEELFEVSDAGLLMPPKSTWFEPKLRSGLFIHSIKQELCCKDK